MDELIEKGAKVRWWYYGVELGPGLIMKGAYPEHTPMLPRLLMRIVDPAGCDCLDLGSMEGLVPALWKRRGANRVIAVDAVDHCRDKMAALKRAHGVEFGFGRVGLMYNLHQRVQGGFDLINVSGLLYHVFSPMHVLAGVRPLLKRNGLMVISTPVHERDDFTMEYNAGGRLQTEANTFWYPSARLFEEWVRSFKMRVEDCLYMPFEGQGLVRDTPDLKCGYLSVLCRAVDDDPSLDEWTRRMHAQSWEYQGLGDVARMNAQPISSIPLTSPRGAPEPLHAALREPARRITRASDPSEAHILLLSHQH